ncbi:MAG: endolytic transglycosylase MltG, partial [Coriobacteriia bacterium]|nr:endolytic transglycosylase MltG [Coriobacteriia bacterium]
LAKTGAAQFAPDHPYLSGAYAGSLEGYLFPKTYRFKAGTTATEAIEAMLDQFDVEFQRVDMTFPESRGISVHEVVVLASMIEREVKIDTERELVSSVIYNRLGRGMLLEIDATIEYVLPGNRFRLRNSDLALDSPYNTYRYEGLPPGAISNPGSASLMAAARPAQTDYLYYVLTSKDGSHTFCKTQDEFFVAKAKSKEVFGK